MNKKIKRVLQYIGINLVVSVIISISLVYGLYQKEIIEFNFGNSIEEVTITRVVDGDTIIVLWGEEEERVRLIGIDSPESVHPDKKKNTDIGKLASEYMKTLLHEEMVVYLEFEETERDFFGRLLAYVWLEDQVSFEKEKDIKKHMVNAILLKEGYAVAHKYPPNDKNHQLFIKIQENAKKEKRGLWKEYSKEMKAITY